jgi:hypothetical protein
MRKILLVLTLFVFTGLALNAQNLVLEVPIIKTGTIEDEDEEGVIIDVSTDDCEQENDEIDTPYDDDLDAGWEGEEGDANILTVGLRFQNITIPAGATIHSAYIKVWSHEGKSTADVAKITITAEATDNAETFNETDLITDRSRTSASVLWEVADEWIIWQPYETPDLKEIVQEVIDRGGWESGNAIAFILEGEDQGPSDVENAREFEAFENIADPEDTDPDGNPGDGQNHPERVPRLFIEYSLPAGVVEIPIIKTGTIEDEEEEGVIIDVSTDDCEQENDEIDTPYDDDLDAGWEGEEGDANILTVGLRFQNVPIPAGSKIDSAFIKLWSHEGKSSADVAKITIYGEANDNPETYNETDLITDRPATETSVLWTVDEEWVIWQPYRTPDLSEIVQELVNRDGWQEGNAMAFVFSGEDQGPSDVENAREFEAFENIADPEDTDPDGNPGDGQNHPERVPRLFIYYSAGATGIKDQKISASTFVYPNPVTNGILNISLDNNNPADIAIFDINGKTVKSYPVQRGSKNLQIEVNNLSSGMYFIKAIQKGKVYNQKLIIK